MSEHRTSVRLQRAWNEWRAECSCGWIGSYCTDTLRPQNEAAQHEQDAAASEREARDEQGRHDAQIQRAEARAELGDDPC